MISAIAGGLGLGLLVAVLVGPVFFALIQTSIQNGQKLAISMAAGILVSDGTYVFLSYAGALNMAHNHTFQQGMGLGGGILLCIFGLLLVFKKQSLQQAEPIVAGKKDILKSFLKGFALNFINPSVIIFWLTMVATMMIEFKSNAMHLAVFFCTTLCTIFVTDLIKIKLSVKLIGMAKPNRLKRINQVSGCIMILYGFKLLIETYLKLTS